MCDSRSKIKNQLRWHNWARCEKDKQIEISKGFLQGSHRHSWIPFRRREWDRNIIIPWMNGSLKDRKTIFSPNSHQFLLSFMILQNTTTSIHKNGSVSKDDVCEKGCEEENEKARWKWPCLVSWLDSIMTSLLAPKENSRGSYFFAQTQTRSAISSGTCMHATKYPAQFSGPNIDFGLFECLSSAID